MKLLSRSIAFGIIAISAVSCTPRDTAIEAKCKQFEKGTEAFANCMTNQRISKKNQFIFKYGANVEKDGSPVNCRTLGGKSICK